MHFVGFSNGCKVGVTRVAKPIEPSVNEHVVDQKVAQAIGGDSSSNPKTKVGVDASGDEAPSAGYGKNQEESVVLLKESRFVLVVVFVEIPHGAMHQVFVCSPSHAFHGAESGDDDEGGDQDFHGNKSKPMKKEAWIKNNNPAARLVRRLWTFRHAKAKPKAMTHQAM